MALASLTSHRHVTTSETSSIDRALGAVIDECGCEARHDINVPVMPGLKRCSAWVIGEIAIAFQCVEKANPPPFGLLLCLHGSGASVSFPDSRVLRNYYCLQEKTVACLLLQYPLVVPVSQPRPLQRWLPVRSELRPRLVDGRMRLPPPRHTRASIRRISAVPVPRLLAASSTRRRE